MSATTPSRRSLTLLVNAILAPLAWIAIALLAGGQDVHWGLAGFLAGLWALGFLAARSGRGEWVLALVSVGLCVAPEVALRAIGFRWDYAGQIVFGAGSPEGTIRAERDPDLFWTLPVDRPDVNSDGFMDGEFVIPKPQGVTRIVFFGDSCTQQGYPSLAGQMLESARSRPFGFDIVNLAVAGYSSYQGKVLAERWAARLEPDLAVVYFGWNDHWQAIGCTDAERAELGNRMLVGTFTSSRLFQLLVLARGAERPTPSGRVRVSLPEYRANLEAIGERVLAEGSELLLLTAPSAQPIFGVDDELLALGMAVSKQSALDLHRRYNEEVRALARRRHWPLLDLAAKAERLPEPEKIFKSDGIHFTPKGLHWVASHITDYVLANADDAKPQRSPLERGPFPD
jgi:lysophospholipase L1-like esterase